MGKLHGLFSLGAYDDLVVMVMMMMMAMVMVMVMVM